MDTSRLAVVRRSPAAAACALVFGLVIGCAERARQEASVAPPVPPPLGLPELSIAAGQATVALGRKLFFDRRLSFNDTMSCAMCHVPEQGFTSNELGAAIGAEGRSLRRNAPTIYNVAHHPLLFHDGREDTLEHQVWGPLLAANEMANPSVGHVIGKLRSLPDYRSGFERAFGARGVDMQTLGAALAAYQRTVVSGNSRFDRWRYAGDAAALSAQELRGHALFTGKANCSRCHTISERHALFSDFSFHNTGIGARNSLGAGSGGHKVQLAPGVFVEVDADIVARFSEPKQNDVGRYEITHREGDRWAYKTPSLRNIALTAPYMHDGSFTTLADVVDFYDRGGFDNADKSPLLVPLGLDAGEKAALVAFLRSLTGDNVAALAADARRDVPE